MISSKVTAMHFNPGFIFAAAALVAACAIAMPVNAAEIKIISTPAASTALRMAARDFERATGHKVIIEFSNIATTRKRIAAGEDFDMAVVSPKAIDDLTQQGKVAAGASLNMGRTGLALVGHKGSARPDIGTVESFKRTLLDARLVAYSATGESGIGFLKVLDKLGITDAMKPRIRSSSNMASTSSPAKRRSASRASARGFPTRNWNTSARCPPQCRNTFIWPPASAQTRNHRRPRGPC